MTTEAFPTLRPCSRIILFSIIQIEQFHSHKPPRSPMIAASQRHKTYSHPVETNRDYQTFVYNADEVSLETLLNPNFRPMTIVEQQQQQQQQPPPPVRPASYQTYHSSRRSGSISVQDSRYERSSFDPLADLPAVLPSSTMPTRRRHHPALNQTSIIHL